MRPLTRLVTVLLVTAAVACGDKNNVVAPIGSIAGTWNLQTVDGRPLPVTLDQTGDTIVELTAITMTLTASTSSSGSFSLSSTIRLTENGQSTSQTNSVSGTYSLNGAALSLTANGQTITGSWNGGNTLTLSDGGSAFVFARQ